LEQQDRTHGQDHDPGHTAEREPVGEQERTELGGGCTKRDEDDREAGDEEDSRDQRPAPRPVLRDVARRPAAVGEIARQERQAAAPLTMAPLEGGPASLADVRGTPVVVDFWACWCVPWRPEGPVLNATASRDAGSVEFLGVDIQDTDAAARAYQSDIRSPYPV